MISYDALIQAKNEGILETRLKKNIAAINNFRDPKTDYTLLMTAVDSGDKVIAMQLIKIRIDVNYQTIFGKNALFLAVKNNDLEMVRLLCQNGIYDDDDKALLYATKNDYVDIVSLLILEGVSDDDDGKVLLKAVKNNNTEIVKLLIDNDVTHSDKLEPLVKAVKNDNIDIVKILIKSGVSKDDLSEAMEEAVKKGNLNIVSFLIEVGVSEDDIGEALLEAAKNNDIAMVTWLLKQDFAESFKDDALIIAIKNNNIAMVTLLTEAGAHEEAIDFLTNKSAEKIAKEMELTDIVSILKKSKLRKQARNFLGFYEQHEGYHDALSVFIDKFDRYHINDLQFAPLFAQINEAFHATLNTYSGMNINIPIFTSTLKQNYDEGKLIIIPSGWPEHSITLAALQVNGETFLIIANRGEGMQNNEGAIIYRLKKSLSQEDILNLLNNVYTENEGEKETLMEYINNLVDSKFAVFLHKGQEHGSCEIANKKTMVACLLPFLHFIATQPQETMSQGVWEKWIKENKENFKIEYKKFSYFLRNEVLNELLQELKTDPQNDQSMLAALSGFCNEHSDLQKESELRLLYRLVCGIPNSHWDKFLQYLKNETTPIIKCLKQDPLYYPIRYGHVVLVKQVISTNFTTIPFWITSNKLLNDIRDIVPLKNSQEIAILQKWLYLPENDKYKIVELKEERDFLILDKIRSQYIYMNNQAKRFRDLCVSTLRHKLKALFETQTISEEEINDFSVILTTFREHWTRIMKLMQQMNLNWNRQLSKTIRDPSTLTKYQTEWNRILQKAIGEYDEQLQLNFALVEDKLNRSNKRKNLTVQFEKSRKKPKIVNNEILQHKLENK